MEIMCPLCQKKLSLADEHAGKLMKCPACSGMFTAPSLLPAVTIPAAPTVPPVPVPLPTPTSPLEAYKLEPLPGEKTPPPVLPPEQIPVKPPEPVSLGSTPPPPTGPVPGQVTGTVPPPAPEPESTVKVPGEYTRAFIIHFNPTYIPWFAPVSLGIIFLLSFLTWYQYPSHQDSGSLWSLAGEKGTSGIFLPYLVFLLLALVLAIANMLWAKKVFTLPEAFKIIRPWRSLVVGGVIFLGFFLLFLNWLYCTFNLPALPKPDDLSTYKLNPTTVWLKIALPLHGLALLGSLLEFWLERRRKKDLPIPKIELRW